MLLSRRTLIASSNFFCLLITFAKSLDPDQDRQNVGPDLDPKCLTILFLKKVNFEKSQQMTTKA